MPNEVDKSSITRVADSTVAKSCFVYFAITWFARLQCTGFAIFRRKARNDALADCSFPTTPPPIKSDYRQHIRTYAIRMDVRAYDFAGQLSTSKAVGCGMSAEIAPTTKLSEPSG